VEELYQNIDEDSSRTTAKEVAQEEMFLEKIKTYCVGRPSLLERVVS